MKPYDRFVDTCANCVLGGAVVGIALGIFDIQLLGRELAHATQVFATIVAMSSMVGIFLGAVSAFVAAPRLESFVVDTVVGIALIALGVGTALYVIYGGTQLGWWHILFH